MRADTDRSGQIPGSRYGEQRNRRGSGADEHEMLLGMAMIDFT